MKLFDISDEVYPQLAWSLYATLRAYYTAKVKSTTITLTTASIKRIFNPNLHLSKFSPAMPPTKVRKICLEKYAHLVKIKRTNESNTTL